MDPKPVTNVPPPAYPTRREVLAGVVSFAVVGLTEGFASAEADAKGITVAPIFQHGEGRGAGGCVVVSPPVFLSEEESMQIVKEELAKHGVQLAAGRVLKDLTIAPRRWQQIEGDEKSLKSIQDKAHTAPMRVTGMDEKKAIAIVFICMDDYKKLGGLDSHSVDIVDREGHSSGFMMSSVSEYDLKDAAQYVATEIRQKTRQRLYVGVLYDPITRMAWRRTAEPSQSLEERRSARKKARDSAAAESKRLVRQQAQDFAAWLKTQKAIP
jgi:hypothetical protein